ncbi:lipid-A-disaccharide synthase [Hyphococcus sp.]|jgi:lipid-A-disaccharide synthase|uniref:lipid-A-disaccharide synthase n=1 Tax=Hyphococcus sp. TaxID=2038636 RepID=UPI003D0B6D46
MKILLCALEPSADALGAALMKALQDKRPNVNFIGCGGALMEKEGLTSLFEIAPFSVLGPVAALSLLPRALKAADALADLAADEKPDAAIFIDSWSFARIAAEKFQKKAPEVKRFKYVAPQVWASRPKRAEKAAQLFDGVMCLFDFETPYFEAVGAKTRFVGHPGFQAARDRKVDKAAFRRKFGLGEGPLLAVLPGSRASELARLGAPFRDTVKRAADAVPGLRIVIPAAPSVAKDLPEYLAGWPGAPVIVEGDDRPDAFAAADVALAASGTAASELSIMGTPMVVAYKLDLLTELWVRSIFTIRYAALANIAADREVIPEFLQRRCTPELMAPALIALLKGGPEREAQLSALPEIVRGWTGGDRPAAEMAAEAVLDWVNA